jgi:hypothetical protein
MKWSDFYLHRLLQASTDLSNQIVEVQKLRAAIRSAKVSKQRLKDPKNGVGGLRSSAGATSKVERPKKRLIPFAGADRTEYEWKARR